MRSWFELVGIQIMNVQCFIAHSPFIITPSSSRHCHSGSVEHPFCNREVVDSIPGRIITETLKMMLRYAGVKLQGDWGEIVALEVSKLPWEAQRATKTSPSIFATFEKASTCAKQTFCWEKSSKN